MRYSSENTSYVLYLLKIVRILFSVLTLPLIAKFFGAGIERDIWIIVTSIYIALASGVWGPINEVLSSRFARIREECDDSRALKEFGAIIGFTFLVCSILGFILFCGIDGAIKILGANWSESEIDLFKNLFIIFIPSILINQLNSIGLAVLNSYRIYLIPEIVGLISAILNYIILLWLAPRIGIYSLLLSQYFGIVFLLLFIIFYLRRNNIELIGTIGFDWQVIKPVLLISTPFFFPYIFGQISFLFERSLATGLGVGSVSIVDYARQFAMLLQALISGVLLSVMVPSLSKYHAAGDSDMQLSVIKSSFSPAFIILFIGVCVLSGSSYHFTDFIFNKGNLSFTELNTISKLMLYYGLAMLGVVAYLFVGSLLLSTGIYKPYAIIGFLTQLFVVLLNFILVKYLGVLVFPIAFGLAHLVAAIFMMTYLKGEVKNFVMLRILIFFSVTLLFVYCLSLVNKALINMMSLTTLMLDGVLVLMFLIIFSNFFQIDLKLPIFKRKK